MVQGDRDALLQALLNVMENARKYAADGGYLDVHVEADPANLRITIRDHGPGIPEAERGAVFERFRRGTRQQSGSVPGVGLGLYLARTILLHHGGELEARAPDDGGKGACFVFTLPATQQLRQREEPTEVKAS